MLAILPFAIYAARFGLAGLTQDLSGETYLVQAGAWLTNISVFVHMLAGSLLSFLAPLQLFPWLRRYWPAVHRATGRLLILCAILTALAGLIYIALRGTVGGTAMDAGFALYGGLTGLAAVQAFRFAIARDIEHHRRWALRLFVLAIGSWLYRVQYTIWYIATDGLASTPDFSGTFDLFMNFGFYLPWLALLELILFKQQRRERH